MDSTAVGDPCPCGSGRSLGKCCGPILAGHVAAPTAEALMRSRYTAFALGSVEHLTRTWDPATRPAAINIDPARKWTGLEIIDSVDGRELASSGVVEFRASWQKGRQSGQLHERSTFGRIAGCWVYVGGA